MIPTFSRRELDRRLVRAAQIAHAPEVERLLKLGANANSNEVLLGAAQHGQSDIIALLLEYGANPYYPQGQPLRVALQKGFVEVAELLTRKLVDSNFLDLDDEIIDSVANYRHWSMADAIIKKSPELYTRVLVALFRVRNIPVVKDMLTRYNSTNVNDESSAAEVLQAAAFAGVDALKLILEDPRFRPHVEAAMPSIVDAQSMPSLEHALSVLPDDVVPLMALAQAARNDRGEMVDMLYAHCIRRIDALALAIDLVPLRYKEGFRLPAVPFKYIKKCLDDVTPAIDDYVRVTELFNACIEEGRFDVVVYWFDRFSKKVRIDFRRLMGHVLDYPPHGTGIAQNEMVDLLTDRFDYSTDDMKTFMMRASRRRGLAPALRIFIEIAPKHINTDKAIQRALLDAVAGYGDAEMVKVLLDWGARPDALGDHKAVSIASQRTIHTRYGESTLRILSLLLNAGGDLAPFLQSHPSEEERRRLVSAMIREHTGVMLSWYRRRNIGRMTLEERTQLLGGEDNRKLFKDYQLQVFGRQLKENLLPDELMHEALQFSYHPEL